MLQEFVHFIPPQLLEGYGVANAQQPIILVQPKVEFQLFGATVSNITLVVIAAATIPGGRHRYCNPPNEVRPGIRAVAQDPTTATLMGVSRERIIMATFLIGGLLAGAAALLYTLKRRRESCIRAASCWGSRRFRLRCSAASGTLGVPLLGACCWESWRITGRRSSVPNGATSSRSCCSCWSF